MPNLDFKSINACALGSLGSLVRGWLPNGRIERNEYVALNPTRHDNSLGSFRINIVTGQWIDFATGDKGGDVISLYAYIKGISQLEAAKQLSQNNYFAGDNYPKAPKSPKLPKVDTDSIKFVAKIWAECVPLQNTLAQEYLKSRGIHKTSPNIRFHPKLYHGPTMQCYPAMVAAIKHWESEKVIGIHRTYLNPKTAKKADIPSNKMMLGSVGGGAVQLAPFDQPLVLAEGIETALSIAQATSMCCWAVLSASNYKNLLLPPVDVAEDIIIAADHDEAGIRAANKAAIKWSYEGRRVSISIPPRRGQDFNDILQGVL